MKTEGIILAAGLSSRMGKSKLELPLGDKSVIERTIISLQPYCSKIVLVCGKHVENITRISAQYPDVRIVYNDLYESGMFSSVRKGVSQISCDYFFLIPGDCPLVNGSTFAALLQYASEHPESSVIIPAYEAQKGHPVLLRSDIKEKILEAPAASSLREVIASNGFATLAVEDKGILLDLDTDEDYKKMLQTQMQS